jgi:glutamate:GABA antiporter
VAHAGPGSRPESGPGRAALARTLTTRDIVLLNVAAIVGLRWIALAAANGPSSLFLWVLAAIVFFIPQGFAVIALASAMPEEGGLYVWTMRAFGPRHGFISGWLYWASNILYFPTVTLSTVVFGLYIFGPRFAHLEHSAAYATTASLVVLAIALALNIVGMKTGRWVQNIGGIATWLPVGALLLVGVMGLVRFGPATPITAAALVPSFGRLPTVLFFSSLCFGYAGLELGPILAGEVIDPRRAFPRAVVISGLTIAACYVLGTLALMWALPAHQTSILSGVNQAIANAGIVQGMPWLGSPVALLMTLGGLGGIGAWLIGSARLLFVGGLNRQLPPIFSRTQARWKTPYVAMLVQGVLSAAFIVVANQGDTVKGAYQKLVNATLIVYFIPYLYMFAAAIRLRGEVAREPRAVPIPGGRAGSLLWNGLGLVTTGVAIVLSLIPPADVANKARFFGQVFAGSFGFVAAGLVLHAVAARSRERDLAGAGHAQ